MASVTVQSVSAEEIVAVFALGSGGSSSDYVAVCKSGSAEGEYITYQYAAGTKSGDVTIPVAGWEGYLDGQLVLRYYTAAGASAAESSPFTMGGAPAAPSAAASSSSAAGGTVAPTSVTSDHIAASFSLTSHKPTSYDYIAVCAQGCPEGLYVTYSYVTAPASSGSVSIAIAGYEASLGGNLTLRYYDGNGKTVCESAVFTTKDALVPKAAAPAAVAPPAAAAAAPVAEPAMMGLIHAATESDPVEAEWDVSVCGHAPSTADTVAVCPYASPANSYIARVNATGGVDGKVSISLGAMASQLVGGLLVLRYYSAAGAVLAEGAPFTFAAKSSAPAGGGGGAKAAPKAAPKAVPKAAPKAAPAPAAAASTSSTTSSGGGDSYTPSNYKHTTARKVYSCFKCHGQRMCARCMLPHDSNAVTPCKDSAYWCMFCLNHWRMSENPSSECVYCGNKLSSSKYPARVLKGCAAKVQATRCSKCDRGGTGLNTGF